MSCILYGSQTGQAKSIAEDLYDKLKVFNKNITIFELDDVEKLYEIDKLNYAIIICSTTGDGDAPDNASKFVRKIKNYKKELLMNLKYTILGLGDTNYSNFCNCGKLIHQSLLSLGATLFYPVGWADDAIGLEICIEPWLDGLYDIAKEMCDNVPISGIRDLIINEITVDQELKHLNDFNELLGDNLAGEIKDKNLTVPAAASGFLQISYNHDKIIDYKQPVSTTMMMPSSNSNLLIGDLVKIDKITKQFAIKPVHKVTIDVPNCEWRWNPGDSVCILPSNSVHEVDSILSRLNVADCDRHCIVQFSLDGSSDKRRAKIPDHLVVSSTDKISLQSILLWLCDIRQPLSKVALRVMSEYCPAGSSEQRRLLELSSREGQTLYLRCIRETSMPVLDLLNWFPSCQIPIERLLEVLPRLKPRAYSLCDLQTISFAFSKVDIAPISGFRKRPLTGVCTSWMESFTQMKTDQITRLPIYLRKNLNGFTVSEDPSVPHILIGPGTGVSPFIGFLQHFERLKKTGLTIGPVWLFFGCRNEERDFIFQEQLEYFSTNDIITHLCVCFSRQSSSSNNSHNKRSFCQPADCKYVQDCLMSHAQSLTNLVVNDRARVFVCGDASGMSKDVLACWPKVLVGNNESVKTLKQAEDFITTMRVQKLYLEDIWV